MSDKCPQCGAQAVLFADYEKNDQTALGLRCARRCGWTETMADLREQLAQRDEQLAAEKLENAKLRAALHDHEAMIEEADKKLAAAKAGLDKALAAAQTLCRIYFDIASEAVGEGEVNRQREKRISAELAKEKP